MCDTMGRIQKERSFFAKNSDRSPNEIQILEYHEGKQGLSGTVDCTYISVPQAEETFAVLLSRPAWMWGAEMGVNQWGVCIGNEAVFTKGVYGKTGLTGMDMVRLALERSKTAKDALELLISLLETYGQGGNCGFDHDFYYDNAFLIMDRESLYVLETAGKQWAYQQSPAANISNRLSIGADADGYSGGVPFDFCRRFTEPVYTTFSGSAKRMQQLRSCLPTADSVAGCVDALGQHAGNVKNPFARGSVSSACMHFGGLVGDHTTSSMVVSLEQERTVVWSTGSSLPCVSLFKPWLLGTRQILPVISEGSQEGEAYWLEAERFRRQLLGRKIPEAFYREKDEIQQRWIAQAESISDAEYPAFSQACLEEERAFYEKWKGFAFEACACAPGFAGRWAKKNKALYAIGSGLGPAQAERTTKTADVTEQMNWE